MNFVLRMNQKSDRNTATKKSWEIYIESEVLRTAVVVKSDISGSSRCLGTAVFPAGPSHDVLVSSKLVFKGKNRYREEP